MMTCTTLISSSPVCSSASLPKTQVSLQKISLPTFIKQFTKEDGYDLGEMLGQAFQVMNVPDKERSEEPTKELNQFPYVNGGLFASDIPIPKMGYKARKIIIDAATSIGRTSIRIFSVV